MFWFWWFFVGFVQRAGNIPLWTVSHSDFPLRAKNLSEMFHTILGYSRDDDANFCVTIGWAKYPHTKVDSQQSPVTKKTLLIHLSIRVIPIFQIFPECHWFSLLNQIENWFGNANKSRHFKSKNYVKPTQSCQEKLGLKAVKLVILCLKPL